MHVLFKMEIKVISEINSKNLKRYKILLMFFDRTKALNKNIYSKFKVKELSL